MSREELLEYFPPTRFLFSGVVNIKDTYLDQGFVGQLPAHEKVMVDRLQQLVEEIAHILPQWSPEHHLVQFRKYGCLKRIAEITHICRRLDVYHKLLF